VTKITLFRNSFFYAKYLAKNKKKRYVEKKPLTAGKEWPDLKT
jgi:hypothetical protein